MLKIVGGTSTSMGKMKSRPLHVYELQVYSSKGNHVCKPFPRGITLKKEGPYEYFILVKPFGQIFLTLVRSRIPVFLLLKS